MSAGPPLSFYFNKNGGLATPFLFLPQMDGQYVFIEENDKYYKFMVNSDNHYQINDYVLKNRESWVECKKIEKYDCAFGSLSLNLN